MKRHGATLAIVGLLVVLGLSVAAASMLNREPGHMPLHIGCKYHNHGPKWFARHGQSLWRSGAAESEPKDDGETQPLASRAVTRGR